MLDWPGRSSKLYARWNINGGLFKPRHNISSLALFKRLLYGLKLLRIQLDATRSEINSFNISSLAIIKRMVLENFVESCTLISYLLSTNNCLTQSPTTDSWELSLTINCLTPSLTKQTTIPPHLSILWQSVESSIIWVLKIYLLKDSWYIQLKMLTHIHI